MSLATAECIVRLKEPHAEQQRFLESTALRKMIMAGRRSGKTTGLGIAGVLEFLHGERVLYAAPIIEQVARWWTEVTRALAEPIAAGLYKKNETEHVIELPGTEQQIRAKTAWDPNALRSDYCSLLILDEFHLMHESVWSEVALPMLLDKNGRSVLCFTPPSFRSMAQSRAKNPRHAIELYRRAQKDTTGRWECYNFSSFANPYLSKEALDEIAGEMTNLAYRQEVLAEDIDDSPFGLFKRKDIVYKELPS